jgi:hypothetical protein
MRCKFTLVAATMPLLVVVVAFPLAQAVAQKKQQVSFKSPPETERMAECRFKFHGKSLSLCRRHTPRGDE